jgi:RNA polymerase sigma factor (sigma-70 family)
VRVSIHDIWSLVRDGDPGAWQELVDRYAGLVYTVARHVGLSPMDAEDVAQHTWLSLYRNRHTITDADRLPVWLITTTRRRAIRLYRKLIRIKPDESQETAVCTQRLPDEEVAALERQAHLEYALTLMDERCRTLLTQLFFSTEEKSYQDIAREMGMPVNSMGATRMRCLGKLKRILNELGYL